MAGVADTTPANRPRILAHRGASADAPENTLSAFRLAAEQGADGVELDVWRCATGEVVVHHDAGAARTGGVALLIRRATLRELRGLDVGAWKHPRFRGERIPLLAEVLEALPGAFVNVELKSDGRPDLPLAAAAARVVRAAGAAGRCVLSSFDGLLLAAARAAAPDLPRAVLCDAGAGWEVRAAVTARLVRAEAIHPRAALVTAASLASWRRRGLVIRAWTVDDEREVARLARLGVDAIVTNRPAAALAAARRAVTSPPPR